MRPELTPRAATALLVGAMGLAGAGMLIAGRGLSFSADELFYFARFGERDGELASFESASLEYLLTPHNGHLQAAGKLVYEAVFALGGAEHWVLRVIEALGVLVCVVLFFVLAGRRVGSWAALAGSLALLALGSAWEVMLWPFDIHTVLALAAGLGALLALESPRRHSDLTACVLLCLSVLSIELGLAFVVAVALGMILARRRLGRAWVFLVPAALYGAWWIWARRFEQPNAFAGLDAVPVGIAESLSAVISALLGFVDYGPGAYPYTLGLHAWGAVLAVLAALFFLFLLLTRRVPVSTWTPLAALLAYWALIGLGDRAADSSRYLFPGALLLLLVAADLGRGRRWPLVYVAGLFVLVALAAGPNVAKLYDGRRALLADAYATRTGFAMLELAGDRAPARYVPGSDPSVAGVSPVPFFMLDAETYFRAAERFGSLAYTLEEVEGHRPDVRAGADIMLSGAYELALRPVPSAAAGCRVRRVAAGSAFSLPFGRVLLRSSSEGEPGLRLARFAPEAPSVIPGSLPPGRWMSMSIPRDASALPWRGIAEEPLEMCSVPSAGVVGAR